MEKAAAETAAEVVALAVETAATLVHTTNAQTLGEFGRRMDSASSERREQLAGVNLELIKLSTRIDHIDDCTDTTRLEVAELKGMVRSLGVMGVLVGLLMALLQLAR